LGSDGSSPAGTGATAPVAGDAPTVAAANGAPVADADRWRWWGLDLATWVFVAYLVVAFFLLLHLGRAVWFAGDEFGLLVDRSLGEPTSLLPPQNSHWSTLPILVYKTLFAVFGLKTYLPYQAATILLHLTLVVLVRVIMRRAGVRPWMATIAASTLVLFGLGHENILWGVQVSQVGSMVLGFGHAILADHDGRFDRRDLIGIGLGALGLMSSGIGPPLVIAVGLAVLLRRGWRMAAVHTVPLALLYVAWYLGYRDRIQSSSSTRPTAPELVEWVTHAVSGMLEALTHYSVAALLLVVVVAVGLVLAVRRRSWDGTRHQAAIPLAFAVGAVVLSAAIGWERWALGVDFARLSRYLAMGVALFLPLIAVAMDEIARRWRASTPALVLLLLLGVPANLEAFDEQGWPDEYYTSQRVTLILAATHPCADLAPRDLVPFPNAFTSGWVDMGFLVDARDAGKLPALPDDVGPLAVRQVEEALGFGGAVEQTPEGVLCDGVLVPGAELVG
jgi:hypothetical protein